MNRILFTLGAATVATVVAVAVPAGAAGTADRNERTIPAQMVMQTTAGEFTCAQCGPGGTPLPVQTCSYAIFVQFPEVKGAEDYNVVVQDLHPRVNTTYDKHGPPFEDQVEGYTAPAGSHWFGPFTGGSYNQACTEMDPYQNGRFKILKAVATMGQTRVVSGRIRARANAGPGRVRVNLIGLTGGRWHVISHTTSDVEGRYEIQVPGNRKDVKRWRVGATPGNWCVTGVRHCAETGEIVFDKSGDEDRRTVDFESGARHERTWGRDSTKRPDASTRIP